MSGQDSLEKSLKIKHPGPSGMITATISYFLVLLMVTLHPQTGVIASFGTQLLEWLEKYTFPEESLFSDLNYAREKHHYFLIFFYLMALRQRLCTALFIVSSGRGVF